MAALGYGRVDLRWLRPYAWALVLLLFIPASLILELAVGPGVAVFVTAGLGIVPLAWFMGLATEEIGKHAGPGVGGLLNATFGNATELIIALFALAQGLQVVVKASLTGSIVGNLLLVLGLSMVAGGVRHKTQSFSREASGTHTTMLLVAVIGLAMPALYVMSAQAAGGVDITTLDEMSLGIAAILLATYAFGLLFSLRTHRDIFNPVAQKEEDHWPLGISFLVLLGSTALVAVESELLVGSLEAARAALGLRDLFLGVIVVAIIGNAAEHGSAVLMALRNKMDLSIAVAMTSTTQIALFVAPILVFASLLTAQVMTLDFELFELVTIGLSTAVLAAVISDGRSNWYEGVLLVMVYAVVAVAFFFHP